MKITSKYVLKEHLGPLAFSLGALTSLLLLNYIARKFGDLVGKGLPWKAIAQFFFLSVPFTIAMTLPMAVLVSVLYAFSRLASENEITAFKASGVAMGRLLGPVLWAATALAIGMILFNDQVLPRANHTLSLLQADIARTSPTFLLKEQVLNEIGDTGYQLRASRIDHIHATMRDVTIYDMSQTSPRTIEADSGMFALMQNKKDLQVTLYSGEIEQLADGKPDRLNRIFYTTQLLRVPNVVKSFDPTKADQSEYKSDREMSICELQRAYVRSRTDYLRARLDYDIAVADSLKKPRPKSSPKRKVFLGIGRLYCDAMKAAQSFGVKEAKAQEVSPANAGGPVQDTTKKDTTAKDSTRATVTPAQAGAATPPTLAADTAKPPVLPPSAGVPAPVTVTVTPTPTTTPTPTNPNAGTLALNGLTTVTELARLRVGETLGIMNSYDVEIHKKFALAVACIVFVLLGAPVALRFPRGGVGLVIGVSLFVFALYYSFLIAGEELASRGMLPPWIAMWAANVLFTAAGIPLALRMGSGSGSARGGGFGEWLDNLRYRFRGARAER